MPEYPIEIAPEQILKWIKAELAVRPKEFDVRAERDFKTAGDIDEESVGMDEDMELEAVTSVGLVEVKPAGRSENWILRIRVEDPFGDHVPEGRSVGDTAEEIDLATFEELFLSAGDRASVETVLVADTRKTAARVSGLFQDILTDRHTE